MISIPRRVEIQLSISLKTSRIRPRLSSAVILLVYAVGLGQLVSTILRYLVIGQECRASHQQASGFGRTVLTALIPPLNHPPEGSKPSGKESTDDLSFVHDDMLKPEPMGKRLDTIPPEEFANEFEHPPAFLVRRRVPVLCSRKTLGTACGMRWSSSSAIVNI